MRGEISIAPLLYNIIYTKIVEGAPAEAIFAPEGVPIIPYADGITKTSKSPNAAKLFMNWRLSKEGQAFAIAKLGNITSLKEPPAFPKGWDPKVIKVCFVQFDDVSGRKRDGPLDQALQLADVSRPAILEQRLQRALRQPQPPRVTMTFKEVCGELADVRSALPERGHPNVDAAKR